MSSLNQFSKRDLEELTKLFEQKIVLNQNIIEVIQSPSSNVLLEKYFRPISWKILLVFSL